MKNEHTNNVEINNCIAIALGDEWMGVNAKEMDKES